jgi:NAD dependent epimerase/dehydratase family enzyme
MMAAQATQQVTGQAQAMAQAEQNAQINPIVQLKEQEIAQKAQSDMVKAQIDITKIQSTEAIAEMRIAQEREEALMKEKSDMRRDYRDILNDIRKSDTDSRGQ